MKQDKVINILLDVDDDIGLRDDIAMELSKYDNPEIIKALTTVASNHNEDEMVSESCGESIGEIWTRQNYFNVTQYEKLNKFAKDGVIISIRAYKFEWIDKYHLV